MTTKGKTDVFKIKLLLKNITEITSFLPNDIQREQMRNNIDHLIRFLTFIKQNFINLPSDNDINKINKAIENIKTLLSEGEKNPLIAELIGLKKRGIIKKKDTFDEEKTIRAKRILKEIESLSIDGIRDKLQNEEYSISELRAIGKELGIRSTKGLNRESLAHQITMKIANFRGYQQLSGQQS